MFSRFRSAVRRLRASRRTERDLHDDIRGYVDHLTDEHVAAGMSRAEARRQAMIDLGGIEPVKEAVRDVRAGALGEQWWQDVRYGIRGLRRTPAFTATVVVTIGIGIGVNTTVFTVINAALLTPLPYERSEELVYLGHRLPTSAESRTFDLPWSEIQRWRAESQLFQGVEATGYSPQPRTWRERDEPVDVARFTAGLPALLGIAPQAGRLFTAEEAARRAPVVLLSDELWSRGFDRSPAAVGSTMTIDSVATTVIGVMPAKFRFGTVAGNGHFDVWTPLAEAKDPAVPGSETAEALVRLRTGLTVEAALPLANAVSAQIQQMQPERDRWIPELTQFGASRAKRRDDLRTPLMLLLGATGLVLMVACANIANLLSARGASRRHELAMRAALGASRARLARLLLIEGAVVALLGGGAAVVFAKLTAQAVVLLMPVGTQLSSGLFAVTLPTIDWRVMTFALGTTVLVTMLAVLWPAVRGSNVGLLSSLGTGTSMTGAPSDRRRMSAILQTVQVALALVLATVAGLFATSLSKIVNADLGFDAKGLVHAWVLLPAARYPTPESQQLAFDQALERIRTTPGVLAGAMGNPPPQAFLGSLIKPGTKEVTGRLSVRYAGPTYFSTAGIRLIAGREFGSEDTPATARVAIIDDVGAQTLFSGRSPLGEQISYSRSGPPATIVGVVKAVAGGSFVTRRGPASLYLAQAQQPSRTGMFIMRVGGDASAMLRTVQTALLAFEPDVKTTGSGFATDYYRDADTYSAPQFYLALVAVFATMAVLTAVVGLYGLLAYAVGQRQREIGVRVALGSSAAQIRWLVMNAALRPVVGGLIVGWIAAWLTTGVLRSFLYQVSPRDPVTFGASAAVLLIAALLATIGPIRRATGVDPIHALRAE